MVLISSLGWLKMSENLNLNYKEELDKCFVDSISGEGRLEHISHKRKENHLV